MRLLLVFFVLFGLVLPVLMAQPVDDTEEDDDNVWSGTFQFGGVINTGNSPSKNFNTKLLGKYLTDNWENIFVAEGELDTNDGVISAENARFDAESRYTLTERDYLFAIAGISYDKFAPFVVIVTEAVGYGRILYESDMSKLRFEIGPGVTHRRVAGTRELQNEVILHTAGFYDLKLSETAEFKQIVTVDIDNVNVHTEAISLINTKMTERLALEVSFRLIHDSVIPEGSTNTKKTDTITKIAVVYSF